MNKFTAQLIYALTMPLGVMISPRQRLEMKLQGINISREYKLIQQKKCKLSSSIRQDIVELVEGSR